MNDNTRDRAVELARRLAASSRLRHRRFELLPLSGSGAVFTDVQGRLPGDSTTPEHLADLISSIASVGMLQPVLVEEMEEASGRSWRLVAGERRLRAAKWVATEWPEDPDRQLLPSIVCPGPLSEEERRVWQLVENLAREDLQPGELAGALLFERAAVLATHLLTAGVVVPADILREDDPVLRYQRLDSLRPDDGRIGAPWELVLRRLGLQLSERQARAIVAAFVAMPRELSAEMDAHGVALTTRQAFLKLDAGCSAAADDLWAAVRDRGRPELLASAVRAGLDHPTLDAAECVDLADEARAAANTARSQTLRQRSDIELQELTPSVPPEIVRDAVASIKSLLVHLREGKQVEGYDGGSLKLFVEELMGHLVEKAVA